jgi:dsDNA-specific endonuclease/ATPase MutS2
MNFNELWIGDLVYVRSLRRNGKWEGFIDEKTAQIKIGHSIQKIPIDDLSEAEEEIIPAKFSLPSEDRNVSQPLFDSNSLDLHIEKLNPDLLHQSAEQILLHQTKMCRSFIEFAISKRWISILIIHGKGSGLLKHEVYHLLEGYEEVFHHLEKNNGGAVEVWFRY